ncbi:hypothetical protein D3C72_1468860 [compost metagenome]
MSSPRVLRIVVTMPASISTWAKRRICSLFERFRPDSGNGLNGIRLNLHGTSATSFSSSRACSTPSLTPSSMQYSKVMKSRGANSR